MDQASKIYNIISGLETRFQIDNSVDIHSEQSYKFSKEILKADPWVLNVLEKGLIIPFRGDPPEYFEKNLNVIIHSRWSFKLIRLHRR